MSSRGNTEISMTHKRSRNGCFTCRVRKVRCGTAPPATETKTFECSNCKRLGFQCRWQPPASGERYVPPPKRRRTTGPRRNQMSKLHTDASLQLPDTSQLRESADLGFSTPPAASVPMINPPESPLEQDSVTYSQFPDSQLSFLGDFSLDADFIVGYNPFDLDMAGEGLDFIPLPEVDPSILHSSTDTSQVPLIVERSPNSNTIDPTLHRLSVEDMGNSIHNLAPSMSEDSRRLIQHYLEVMKGYSKVDDRAKDVKNLFISAFSQSLCFPPLLYAILAFSASHLSIRQSSYIDQANTFDRLAEESFQEFTREHGTEVEGLLSALFVRVKMVHVMAGSMDTFLDLITTAANIVSTKEGEKALEGSSTLARRIDLRLAILDARAACYRLGGGLLIERLRHIPSLAFIFDRTTNDDGSRGGVVNLLRANIFRVRVAELDVRLHRQTDSQVALMPPIRIGEVKLLYEDLQREIQRCELELATRGKDSKIEGPLEEMVLDSTTYNSYAILSALHSGVLYLCDVYPLPSFDQELSIKRILHYQLKVQCDTSRVRSPSSILPSSLFQDGLHTDDPIHRD
ncbi:hypothetical protein G7046_g2403 [Stylonectria norvegica]|nr:hypothetical protein G7046_g2403 [Stylonectria norvegica]